MGKRKAEESEKEYIKRKLRKLQKKLKKLPSDPVNPEAETTPPRETQPAPSNPPIPTEKHNDEEETANTENLDTDDVLPEEFLLALGTEGEECEERGPEIRGELASRWSRIMSTGLGKDTKEKILKKYPAPENFLKEAPQINPEIMASLSDVSQKRDKRIVHRQNLTLKALCALGKTLTNVLKGNINSNAIIEEINDAAKIMAEVFYEDSGSRKFFALAGANPTVREAVKDTKPDEFLFGKDCAERIKAAQTIKKTGSQIKNPEPSTNTKPASKQPQQKRQGNWGGPPQQYQRARGGHRQAPKKYHHPPQREQKRHHHHHRSRYTYRR